MATQTLALCAALAACAPPANAADDALTGEQIVALHLADKRSDSEMAFIRMNHKVPGAPEREYRFLVVYQTTAAGKSYFLRLIRPKEVEAVTVLANEKSKEDVDYYFFLPAVGKMKQLTGDARQGAFLGSDYSFEDLLDEMPSWNAYERKEDTEVDGHPCFQIQAIESRKDGGSAYAYRVLFIDREKHHLRKVDFYGKNERLVKTLMASEFGSPEVKGQTTRPRRALMTNHESGSSTEFIVIEGRLNEKFDPALFTPDKLEKWTPEEVEEFIFNLGLTVTAE